MVRSLMMAEMFNPRARAVAKYKQSSDMGHEAERACEHQALLPLCRSAIGVL